MEKLHNIYGSQTFLAPRLMEEKTRWMTDDLHTIEFMTAQLLTCVGAMPIICHRSTLSPDGLAVIAAAGLSIPQDYDQYVTREEYISAVKKRLDNNQTPAFMFSHPQNLFGTNKAVVANRLIETINNKSAIDTLVPHDAHPIRRHLTIGEIRNLKNVKIPVVIKVATDDPNAGGRDVQVCRRRRHFKRAQKRFGDIDNLILEQFINAKSNWCLQYSADENGQITYLGSSQQLCTKSGLHTGNLICSNTHPPQSAVSVGYEIMQTAANRGYRGIAGFDILVDHQNDIFVIDLNFRPVSSTAFVLNYREITATRTAPTARLAYCLYDGSLQDALKLCKAGIDKGWLVPLGTFDPEYGELKGRIARCNMMILGDTMQEIKAREKELTGAGIHISGVRRPWHRSIRYKLKRTRSHFKVNMES